MEEDNSLLNKKGDSHTTKPSDNDKLGNLPIIKKPLESIIIHESLASSANPSDNPRRSLPQQLKDEFNRQRQMKTDHIARYSCNNFSDLYVNAIEEQKIRYVQSKLNAIKFTKTVNQGHGLPFPDQQQQQVPFGLLCRGLTS